MPTFYAVIPLGGDVEYITSTEAAARKGAPLLDVTGFTAYGAPDGEGTRRRSLLGPMLPAPFAAFVSADAYSALNGTGDNSERLTFYGSTDWNAPDPHPEILLEFGAGEPFDVAFSGTREVAYYNDGSAILDFSDFTGQYNLDISYIKVWVATDGSPPVSDFWTGFILAREVP